MAKNEKDNKTFFTEWLEKLQQESWQLELVISGLALYGVYYGKSGLSYISFAADQSSSPFLLNLLYAIFAVGWKIFFINLLIHVILRSLWIGAIGLRYVSDEIEYEKLDYSERFTSYLREKVGDYDDFIEKLEKSCSIIFSYTFLLFLLFCSLTLFIFWLIWPNSLLENYGDPDGLAPYLMLIWTIPFLLLGIVVFIDFITLGSIKRVKDDTVSKIYLPIYRFYSTITLSFLYRPLIYNFIDDKYTRRLFFLSIPYIFLISFGDSFIVDNNLPHFPDEDTLLEDGLIINELLYEDLHKIKQSQLTGEEVNEYVRLPNIRLSAYHMRDEYASVFFKINRNHREVLEKEYNLSPVFKSGWRFSLSNYKKKDEEKEQIVKDYKSKYNELTKSYRAMRDSIRRGKINEAMKPQAIALKDSLQKERAQLNKNRDEKLRNFDKNKNEKILKAFQSMLDVSIDSINYNDSLQCYFTRHPNEGERGLTCNFRISNLKKGNHIFNIEAITSFDKRRDSIRTRKYKLPFIKH